jgi:DMSO reductase anchor subunit
VPDYGALMAWRIVLLVAALVFWIALSSKVISRRCRCCHWLLCWYWRVN